MYVCVYVELSALSTLPYLTHLNVSNNKLTSVLDFNPPKNLLVYYIRLKPWVQCYERVLVLRKTAKI